MADHPTPLAVRDIKTLPSGDTFTGVLLVRRVTTKTAKNGNAFLSLELGDKTGTFPLNVFGDSPAYELFTGLKDGGIVRIEAKVEFYQERLSPRLLRAEPLSMDQLSGSAVLANLVETAPEDADALWAEFQQHIASIGHAELRATVQAVFDDIGDQFRIAPAAVAMHHAYRHGLLEHTTHMARAAKALLPLYPEIDADLAMAGVLVHDTGKVIEYQGDLVTTKSRKGILQGHVVLGYQLVRKAGMKTKLNPDLLERLEHIVLSHQGELEWGAAVIAATPEAVFVAKVDDLDAKMGMVQRLLRQAGEDTPFSDKHLGLNSQLLLTKPVK
ncbi:3'-5' exoribonuclease YhaM [Lacunisphaera limnophila]|uniref:3'-5' exoribonuclease YhaM n=1 Tax=Lacunisphaera limnophila TaxID=1838286 RepID=A0A1D8AYU7_9BACT|nr:HD domain-containing protein [Lacunisphaera limnophila]AOS46066.1 3'-5' exoribonuclease YhaM [Lacunisphaera limnophila]